MILLQFNKTFPNSVLSGHSNYKSEETKDSEIEKLEKHAKQSKASNLCFTLKMKNNVLIRLRNVY